jgi:hypothetical protein
MIARAITSVQHAWSEYVALMPIDAIGKETALMSLIVGAALATMAAKYAIDRLN